jgi:hypothetical protein
MLVHERFGVLTVLLTAFGRAVAEVGAVMIVGGNIDGVTRVMTTAIALETSKGDLPLALALGSCCWAWSVLNPDHRACAARRADARGGGADARGRGMTPLLSADRCPRVLRRGRAAGRDAHPAPRRAPDAGGRQRFGQDHAAAPPARLAATSGPARATRSTGDRPWRRCSSSGPSCCTCRCAATCAGAVAARRAEGRARPSAATRRCSAWAWRPAERRRDSCRAASSSAWRWPVPGRCSPT